MTMCVRTSPLVGVTSLWVCSPVVCQLTRTRPNTPPLLTTSRRTLDTNSRSGMITDWEDYGRGREGGRERRGGRKGGKEGERGEEGSGGREGGIEGEEGGRKGNVIIHKSQPHSQVTPNYGNEMLHMPICMHIPVQSQWLHEHHHWWELSQVQNSGYWGEPRPLGSPAEGQRSHSVPECHHSQSLWQPWRSSAQGQRSGWCSWSEMKQRKLVNYQYITSHVQ